MHWQAEVVDRRCSGGGRTHYGSMSWGSIRTTRQGKGGSGREAFKGKLHFELFSYFAPLFMLLKTLVIFFSDG